MRMSAINMMSTNMSMIDSGSEADGVSDLGSLVAALLH